MSYILKSEVKGGMNTRPDILTLAGITVGTKVIPDDKVDTKVMPDVKVDTKVMPNILKPADVKVGTPDDQKCAPDHTFENGSCFTIDELELIVDEYNKANPNTRIKMCSETSKTLTPEKCKKYLLDELNKIKECDNQRCWVSGEKLKQISKLKNVFRPKGPEGQFTWLNTNDINKVLKQYESADPSFLSFGAVPNDFSKLPLDIATADFKKLKAEGKTKFGVVFNLDNHDQSGSHWVASYADTKQGVVYFFDSYGYRPDPRITKYMRTVARSIKEDGNKVSARYNTLRHQRKNSECGVYSLYFIVYLLNGGSFDKITTERISDDEINKMRDVFFTDVNIKAK